MFPHISIEHEIILHPGMDLGLGSSGILLVNPKQVESFWKANW